MSKVIECICPKPLKEPETKPESREEFAARIRALPPLTDEQLDSLADLLAYIEIDYAERQERFRKHGCPAHPEAAHGLEEDA